MELLESENQLGVASSLGAKGANAPSNFGKLHHLSQIFFDVKRFAKNLLYKNI